MGMAVGLAVLTSCSQMATDEQPLVEKQESEVQQVTPDIEEIPESVFTVVDEKGQTVELKLEDEPVLFLAHWCPHCNGYLETHEPLPDLRVVAVYPRDGETVEEMMNGVKTKLNQAGWEDVPLYGSMDPDIVELVPTIAYMAENVPYHRNAFEVGEGDF
jgi:thiol-disulfide isomerase/thioredoxin